MRHPVDYGERAEECRRLAKLCKRPEKWGHFLEMAETWETGEVALENNRSRGPVSERSISLGYWRAKRSANTHSPENAA
jgi:hypothetical protein